MTIFYNFDSFVSDSTYNKLWSKAKELGVKIPNIYMFFSLKKSQSFEFSQKLEV
jgi:hypothetical protein